jgi:hypothetical protein
LNETGEAIQPLGAFKDWENNRNSHGRCRVAVVHIKGVRFGPEQVSHPFIPSVHDPRLALGDGITHCVFCPVAG